VRRNIKRKWMLRKNKIIMTDIIKKYSPFAQSVILESMRTDKTIDQIVKKRARDRENYIRKNLGCYESDLEESSSSYSSS
jgi:hypothetical protein